MNDPQWLITVRDHGGQKLGVRLRPSAAVADARKRYGYLLVVTQQLTSINTSGMPAADCNRSLASFDRELIDEIEIEGRVVVVETYAGKRIYYAYVADELAAKRRAAQVLQAHAHLSDAEFRGGADRDWVFYSRYTDGLADSAEQYREP